VFSFDGDRAGKAAAWKALKTALPLMQDGCQISFLFLPDGEDPDTMVKKVGKSGFLELIDAAMPLPDFLLNTLQLQADINRLDGRAKLVKLALPKINAFPDGLLKKMVAERIATLAQVSPVELLSGKAPATMRQAAPSRPTAERPSALRMTTVRRAISLLLQYPQLAEEFAPLVVVPPERVRGLELVHRMFEICTDNTGISTAGILERFRDQNYFKTLLELAQHRHNDMDEMSDDEALMLIRSNNQKILSEHQAIELDTATAELEALTSKAAITELTDTEQARKQALAAFLRDQFSRHPSAGRNNP
jgi:DNA primase